MKNVFRLGLFALASGASSLLPAAEITGARTEMRCRVSAWTTRNRLP